MPSMRLSIWSVGLLAASSLSISAADLPSRTIAPAAPIMKPAYTWTGFYIGANFGGAFGYAKNAVWYQGQNLGKATFNSAGVVGGGHIGYNYQMGSMVLSGEADLLYNGISSRKVWISDTTAASGTLKNELGWQGSIRARAGYAVERTLYFLTAGVAIASPEIVLSGSNAAIGGMTATSSATRAGFTVGAGIDHAFTDNWIGKLEYRYSDFGTKTIAGANSVNGAIKNSAQVNTITAGISYKF